MQFKVSATQCLLLMIAGFMDELRGFRDVAADDRNATGKRPLYIGAFIPGPRDSPLSYQDTLQLAVDHVNNLTGILDDYELRTRWNSTETATALLLLNDFVRDGPPVPMIWGPMFSYVAEVVNEVTSRYNIIQVTIATSNTLTDRSRYPLTVLTGGDENRLNPARVEFIKRMGWKKVAIIFEDNQYFRKNMEHLAVLLNETGITILTTEAVKEVENSDKQLQSLKMHDARVICATFYIEPATKLLCKIFRLKLYGAKYIWLLPGWYYEGWWKDNANVSCTNEELHAAVNLSIFFDWDLNDKDLSLADFNGVKLYPDQTEAVRGLRFQEICSYDSLITMALALNASIPDLQGLQPPRRLDEFSYGDAEMAKVLLDHIYSTTFVGLSGDVEFDSEKGRHLEVVQIQQLQGDRVVKFAEHRFSGDYNTIAKTSIQWKGSIRPVDGKTEENTSLLISTPAKIGIFLLSSLGVLTALVFLILNIYLRRKRFASRKMLQE